MEFVAPRGMVVHVYHCQVQDNQRDPCGLHREGHPYGPDEAADRDGVRVRVEKTFGPRQFDMEALEGTWRHRPSEDQCRALAGIVREIDRVDRGLQVLPAELPEFEPGVRTKAHRFNDHLYLPKVLDRFPVIGDVNLQRAAKGVPRAGYPPGEPAHDNHGQALQQSMMQPVALLPLATYRWDAMHRSPGVEI